MTIKEYLFFKMSYKELKDDKEPAPHKSPNGVAYAEILSTLMITAMFCGTLLLTTNMWVQERQAEMGFLRGSNP